MITVTYGMQLLQAATYINTINAGQEQRPDIAALSNGNMFVAWQTEALGIQGSLRTADGQSIGGNFAIAGTTLVSNVKVAALNNGNVVVIFQDNSDGFSDIKMKLLVRAAFLCQSRFFSACLSCEFERVFRGTVRR